MRTKHTLALLAIALLLGGWGPFSPMDEYGDSPSFGCADPIAGTIEHLGCNLVEDSDHCYQDAAIRLKDAKYCEAIEKGPPRTKCYLRIAGRTQDAKHCESIEEVPGGYSKAECYQYVASLTGNKALCEKITKPSSTFAGTYSKENCLTELENMPVQLEDCEEKFFGKDECKLKNALASGDVKHCEGDKDFVDQCVLTVAGSTGKDVCSQASKEAQGDCATMAAMSSEDPAILEKYLTGEELDLARATYASHALDLDELEKIKDNRMYDMGLMMTMPTAFGREGLVPTEAFCNMLRGNYEYNGDDIPEDEFKGNKNLCNTIRVALEDVRDNTGCDAVRESIDPVYEEDVEDAVTNCEGFSQDMQNKIARIESADTPEEYAALMQEFNQ